MKKVIQSILLYIVSAIGISLTLKADVGVSSFNAMNLSISEWTSIKVGTITFIANLIFLFGYICLCEKKDFRKFTLMFVSSLFFGMVINFFLYTIFGTINVENYLVRIGLLIFGAILAGGTTGIILSLDIIPFPIESLCLRIAELTKRPFSQYRYCVDLFSIILSITISLLYNLPINIREGTIISFFLLSGIISYTRLKFKNYQQKPQTNK
ncbi:YczE/YyaS/YitT family protein [Peribacillus frigoritolerans]|uniref:YczE/YyaS/YitT family protein n=1 Tax=Peribacillus frigoritolerans TaxID=450367 RepID=UPI0039A34463